MRIRITSVRTAIVTLAVGCSLFAASGPMAATAFAQANTGGGSQESQQCTDLWNSFESNVNKASNASHNGDTNGFRSALGAATQNVNDARAAGCEWATARTLPNTGGIVASRGPVILAR